MKQPQVLRLLKKARQRVEDAVQGSHTRRCWWASEIAVQVQAGKLNPNELSTTQELRPYQVHNVSFWRPSCIAGIVYAAALSVNEDSIVVNLDLNQVVAVQDVVRFSVNFFRCSQNLWSACRSEKGQ